MKIYFEDGKLRKVHEIPEEEKKIIQVDAENGISFCNVSIVYCVSNYPKGVVYTNSVCGLKPEYSWDDVEGCKLFMRDSVGNWVKAETLLKGSVTLDFFSDIVGMYLSGCFNGGNF